MRPALRRGHGDHGQMLLDKLGAVVQGDVGVQHPGGALGQLLGELVVTRSVHRDRPHTASWPGPASLGRLANGITARQPSSYCTSTLRGPSPVPQRTSTWPGRGGSLLSGNHDLLYQVIYRAITRL